MTTDKPAEHDPRVEAAAEVIRAAILRVLEAVDQGKEVDSDVEGMAKAALEAAERVAWQPIETVPKKGTVLFWDGPDGARFWTHYPAPPQEEGSET